MVTRRLAAESLGYAATSVVALACDVGVLAALVRLGVDNVAAAAAGYCTGLVVHYLIATRYVFRHRRYRDARIVESALYGATGLAGLVLSTAIVWAGDALGLHLAVSKAIAVVASFAAIYLIRRWLLFTAPPATDGRRR
jgi:putative flippase GtrA